MTKPEKNHPAKGDKKRHSTGTKGVFYRWGTHRATGKPEKIFVISYYRDGKRIEEIVGRERQDDMTPARANKIRAMKIDGDQLPRRTILEAERAAREADKGRYTIGRLWAEYVESRYKASSKSHDTDRLNYRKHLEGPLAGKEPHEVAALDVERVRRRMEKELNLQAGTVARVLGLLIRIINFGTDKQLCEEGLSFKIKLPKVRSKKTEHMTDEQTAQYVKVCQDWPDVQAGAFQLFELFTGVRRSEARKLLWADVDIARGFMTLRNPKGGEDQTVNLNDLALELLTNHPRIEGNPFVFAGVHGGARGLKQIDLTARAIRDAAGLPKDFRPNHGLRHAFASHLASSDEVELYTIQTLLTHKSPQMTMRYAHLKDAAQKRGANVMTRIVRQAAEGIR